MLVLRATTKVLKTLKESATETDASDTALGDWYVNRIVVDRKPMLLLVSSRSRLAILTPARDVKNLPCWVGELIADRLARLGLEDNLIRAEVGAMEIVRVGRTRDRSITGQMVDFARAIPYYLPVDEWDESTLRLVEDRLGETPCLSGRARSETVWPGQVACQLLMGRWSSGAPAY
ncbi:DUF6933 domain-containing protein [Thiohalobacter thiocyanaticus]|uniref:DUF6933 domain-containing protein n=1 Tax=Thiohalobacter thiocyanaticus TaxID=585455 RepID=UPI003F930C4A